MKFNVSWGVTKGKITHFIQQKVIQDIAISMYKIKNGSCPDYIFWLFNISSNQFNFRNNDFTIPRVYTTGYGKYSVR